MLPGLRSIIRHRTSICRYSSRRHRSWSKCDEFLPQFTAPFANPQLRCFPLLTQLLLLIEWRSLRSVPQSDFRVNTKSACRTPRVFITVHRAIRKTQLRCFWLLAQLLLLIDWRSLRSVPQSDFRVNTKSACRTPRVNCCIEKCTKKEKSF